MLESLWQVRLVIIKPVLGHQGGSIWLDARPHNANEVCDIIIVLRTESQHPVFFMSLDPLRNAWMGSILQLKPM